MSGTSEQPNERTGTSEEPVRHPRQRPASVPAEASWSEEDNEWRCQELDALGRLHGRFRSWRADGSPRAISSYRAGKQVGASWTLHPDGALSSLGCFDDGVARGVHHRYACDADGAEPLQTCCVPPGAWHLRQDFRTPNAVERGWFRRDGQRVLDSGEPYPDRPEAVWPSASFNENRSIWETKLSYDGARSHGTRREWSADGALRLIETIRDGKRHGPAETYDSGGRLLWKADYVDGRLSGRFRGTHIVPGHFKDEAIRGQTGAFELDQAVGVWCYRNDADQIIAERDMGVMLDEQAWMASPALCNHARPATWWRSLAQTLFAERRIGEALLAVARASARDADSAELNHVLATITPPLARQTAEAEARQALEGGGDNIVTLVDALKRGCDAATILWSISRVLPERDRASLDLVSAALLLNPSSVGALATRALLHGSLGDRAAAQADTLRVSHQSPDQGAFLELYLRVYFPRFGFWPEAERFQVDDEALPITCERSVDEARDVIQRYATRLGRLRETLKARLAEEREPGQVDTGEAGGETPFAIPDLSSLLPAGPVALQRRTFAMSVEDYQGVERQEESDPAGTPLAESASADSDDDEAQQAPESSATVEITIDESRDVDPPPATILGILRRARADWSGLTWLCWAVGLNRVALPDAVRPPRTFARAALMTMERTWRCRDKLRTSGLLAMTKGIPGFDWEGTTIDELPPALAELPLDEYVEARAVFSWLCDTANQSPWQDDLRSNDD